MTIHSEAKSMDSSMPSMKRQLDAPYELVLARLPEALKTEGFGVLTEIDVQKTLKDKLGADFRRYTILGACNPALAQRALTTDLDVGVLLPCNVVVHETEAGQSVVSTVDPERAIGAFGNGELAAVAAEVRERLARVLERLG